MSDERRHPEVRFEEEGVRRGLVLGALAAVVALATVLCVAAFLLLRLREARLRPGREPPESAPMVVAGVDRAPYELPRPGAPAVASAVDRYRYTDRERGIVQVPVEVGIELLLRRAGDGGAGGGR